eukprot:jgi/Galph1/5582/GphlegSOOS_G4219.1
MFVDNYWSQRDCGFCKRTPLTKRDLDCFSWKRRGVMLPFSSKVVCSEIKFVPVVKGLRVVGVGAAGLDFIAQLERFPKPDEKIRTTNHSVQGGGNCANTLTCLRRLGINTCLVTKVGDDSIGRSILGELEQDGVDSKFVIRQEQMSSPFTYVIVDMTESTRTCIHTPAQSELSAEEVDNECLKDASLLHLDTRHPAAAFKLAQQAKQRGVPILVDVERRREGLEDLLPLADYIITNANFPLEFSQQLNRLNALEVLLDRYPAKFVIATLGKEGCVMMSREFLNENQKEYYRQCPIVATHVTFPLPTPCRDCIPKYQVIECPAWPVENVIDTTGAGDSFIGGIIYSLLNNFAIDHMLYFASRVASLKLKHIGARRGLAYIDEIESWLVQPAKIGNE